MTTKLSIEAYGRKVKRNIEYNAKHTTRVPLDMNHNTDADILAYLATVPNKQGLIKELLRDRMKQDGFAYTQEEE